LGIRLILQEGLHFRRLGSGNVYARLSGLSRKSNLASRAGCGRSELDIEEIYRLPLLINV